MLLIGVALYAKLYGFKNALEELVYSRTAGQYSLFIKKSSIDIFELNFTFRDVVIRKNPSNSGKGTHTVTIPTLRLNFGSVLSMLAVKKFNIDNLIIDEPQIEIESPPHERAKNKSATLPQQIVKLYPAVESLLSSFNIKSLTVRRATLELKKPLNNSLRIGLIDLLIEHWNIRRLNKKSQLLLRVAQQELDFGRVSLNFSGIEYNFKERHLLFSDFKLTTIDSISTSHVEVSAKSLLLNRLDYKELYENQRYVLQRAALENPVIHARFALKQGKKNRWIKDKDMLTRILKQTFGECIIDSVMINNARLDLVLQKNNDSVNIELPRVDFKLHSFKVLQESNAFQVGEMETNLNGTTISLQNDLSLRFNKIFFNNERELIITDATIFHKTNQKQLATIGRLKLDYVDLLPLIFNKHLDAHRVTVENATIYIPAREERSRKTKKFNGISEMKIAIVIVRNIALVYNDTQQRFSVNGLMAEVSRVRYDSAGDLHYKLNHAEIRQVLTDQPGQHLHSASKGIRIRDQMLNVDEMLVHKDSLTVAIKRLAAEGSGEITPEHYVRWNKIEFGDLAISGHIKRRDQRAEKEKPSPEIIIQKLQIDHVMASLSDDTTAISFSGNKLTVSDFVFQDGASVAGIIRGDFQNIDLRKPSLHILATMMALDYPANASLTNVKVEKNDFNILLQTLSIHAIQKESGVWRLKKIEARGIGLEREYKNIFESDSIHIIDLTLHEDTAPDVALLEIFHPTLQNIKKEKENNSHVGTDDSVFPIPDRIIVHSGEWRLLHHPILFGRWEADRRKGLLKCSYIHTATDRMNIRLENISASDDRISIDSLCLLANKEWPAEHPVEDDVMNAAFQGISIKGFSRDVFLQTRSLENLDIEVNGFDLDIKRDKRLPDPPLKDKPVTLEGMIHFPEHVSVTSLSLKNGHIRYAEISDKTGAEGYIDLNNIAAKIKIDPVTSFLSMRANASPYNSGIVDLVYQTIDSSSFKLFLKATDIDLTRFNEILAPFQPVRITSGHLKEYDLNITATNERATGKAVISYDKLHFELFKKEDPDKKNRAGLMTFIADGIVLRNKKNKATHEVYQVRITNKSIFNYWVKSIAHGAIGAVRKGKRVKPQID